MPTDTATSLTLTRVIRADREAVFRAWTDPAEMKKWFCPEGGTVDVAESDLAAVRAAAGDEILEERGLSEAAARLELDHPRSVAVEQRVERPVERARLVLAGRDPVARNGAPRVEPGVGLGEERA